MERFVHFHLREFLRKSYSIDFEKAFTVLDYLRDVQKKTKNKKKRKKLLTLARKLDLTLHNNFTIYINVLIQR